MPNSDQPILKVKNAIVWLISLCSAFCGMMFIYYAVLAVRAGGDINLAVSAVLCLLACLTGVKWRMFLDGKIEGVRNENS